MNDNALSTIPNQNHLVHANQTEFTRDQIELLKSTVCKGSTDDEFKLFLTVAKKCGLDPFSKQIHAIKRWDNSLRREVMSIQTGIDGYRSIADRTGSHIGTDDAVFIVDSNGMPVSATVTVYKLLGDRECRFTATARWDEYKQTTKDGNLTKFWDKMKFGQLAKCAEALALRKAFPQQLSGIYTHDEMGQADNQLTETPANNKKFTAIEPVKSIKYHSYVTDINECEDIDSLKSIFDGAKAQLSRDEIQALAEIKDLKKDLLLSDQKEVKAEPEKNSSEIIQDFFGEEDVILRPSDEYLKESRDHIFDKK